MTDLSKIFSEFYKKTEQTKDHIKKIQNLNNVLNLKKKELDLISEISSNINLLNDQFEELYLIILDKTNNEKTAKEKEKLRNIIINRKLQETFLPYMIFYRIQLENYNIV